MKRLFIAINTPQKIKEILASYQEQYSFLPAKWVEKENLHITLFFIGSVADSGLCKVLDLVNESVKKTEPFNIELEKITYFPKKKFPPKMIWAEAKNCKEIAKMQKNLEDIFLPTQNPNQSAAKSFRPHITLARLKQWQLRQMEEEEIFQIDEDINMSFCVNSVELMESQLKRTGPKYFTLSSIPL